MESLKFFMGQAPRSPLYSAVPMKRTDPLAQIYNIYIFQQEFYLCLPLSVRYSSRRAWYIVFTFRKFACLYEVGGGRGGRTLSGCKGGGSLKKCEKHCSRSSFMLLGRLANANTFGLYISEYTTFCLFNQGQFG